MHLSGRCLSVIAFIIILQKEGVISEMDDSESRIHSKPLRIRSESGIEEVYYPLLYKDLPEEAKLYAQRELNETEENKEKGIRKLKEYMKGENLKCPDDRMLIIVLRNCKYDFKKAKTKLKNFQKLYQLMCYKLARMDMNTISSLLEECIFVAFPYRDKQGRIIMYTHPSLNIDKYDLEEIAICGVAVLIFLLSFPMSSIYGVTHLAECYTPHLSAIYSSLKALKIFLPLLKNLPVRVCKVDLFNEIFLIHWGYNMLRPFISEKIKKRVMFHGSGFDNVHKIFHPDVLPNEVGGTMGPLSIKHYKEELLSFIEKLREENLT